MVCFPVAHFERSAASASLDLRTSSCPQNTQKDAEFFRVFRVFCGPNSESSGIAGRRCAFRADLAGDFLSMDNASPNQIAAPNRRLPLGPVPWSFGTLKRRRSAVGELYR
jgi:hypothetical protein